MSDIFSFLPIHTLPWVTHSVCGFKYRPQCILSPLLKIHIFMPTWPTETIIGITNPSYPNISSWYSNLHHPLLHLLLLHLWQLHSSHCSGSKSWWYLWLPPPFLSLCTSDLPKNLLTPTFKICPEFNHFSPHQLALPWSKPPSSLAWIIALASQLFSLILFLIYHALFSTRQSEWFCSKPSDASHAPG